MIMTKLAWTHFLCEAAKLKAGGGQTDAERLSNAADFADRRASKISHKADTMEANNSSDDSGFED